jgi:DNA-binding NarL/FixJ family response regulator
MNVWYLTADLMFSSRVVAQAERAGHAVMMIASPALLVDRLKLAASDPPGLVIIDLTAPGINVAEVVPQIRAAAPEAKMIAYGPHVHNDLLAAAQAAGCDAVMSNGQFNNSLASLL